MIDARELRIGNLVSTYGTNANPNGWTEVVVTSGHIQTCESHPEWYKPIELTEDRLINQFGFKREEKEDENYIVYRLGKKRGNAIVFIY